MSIIRKVFFLMAFSLLTASNIFLIISPAFHSFSSSMLAKIPFMNQPENSPVRRLQELKAENKQLRQRIDRLSLVNSGLDTKLSQVNSKLDTKIAKIAKAGAISRRIAVRTARNVTTNLTSMIGEAAPYIGIGVVIATTALDVKDGCDNIRDINAMLDSFDDNEGREDEGKVCGVKMPTTAELTDKIRQSAGTTLQQSVEYVQGLYDTVSGVVHESKVTGGQNESVNAQPEALATEPK